ncbi:MAG: hypothetical protein ACLR6J_12680 [Parabacteroides merdae]
MKRLVQFKISLRLGAAGFIQFQCSTDAAGTADLQVRGKNFLTAGSFTFAGS